MMHISNLWNKLFNKAASIRDKERCSSSNHFYKLIHVLIKLRRNLLPDEFSPTGDYEDKIRYEAMAFLLLSHAELEIYFEESARAIYDNHKQKWKNNEFSASFHSFCLAYLLKESKTIKNKTKISGILEHLTKVYFAIINKNNGIKSTDIKAMFEPWGVEIEKHNLLLVNLDNHGSKRGNTAHKSTQITILNIDPKTVYQELVILIKELREFDKEIQPLLN